MKVLDSGSRSASTSTSPRRRGSMLIVTLVVLVVLSAVLASSVKTGMIARQQMRAEERLAQAEWLCESGFERAAARLRGDADVREEDWRIPASDLGGLESALVQIQAEPEGTKPGRMRVTVRVELPPDSDRRVTRTRIRMVDVVVKRDADPEPVAGPDTGSEDDR